MAGCGRVSCGWRGLVGQGGRGVVICGVVWRGPFRRSWLVWVWHGAVRHGEAVAVRIGKVRFGSLWLGGCGKARLGEVSWGTVRRGGLCKVWRG